MKIRMKQTKAASTDGVTVREYRAGEVYPQPGFPITEELAAVILAEKWGEEVDVPESVSKPPENKPVNPPETKPVKPRQTKRSA